MRNKPGDNAWKMEPLPDGPYVLIKQDEMKEFEKRYYLMTFEIIKEFRTEWGYATYAINPFSFEPILCGHDFDTTD